jgi:hypothetical protein
MMNYCSPNLPDKYMVKSRSFRCKNCYSYLLDYVPLGDELVKFYEVNGNEVKWLPTYGKGGYLDLLKKLLPDFKEGEEISMVKAKKFETIFQQYMEVSERGNYYSSLGYNQASCSNCKSRDLSEVSEEILDSPDIKWLKISCHLI